MRRPESFIAGVLAVFLQISSGWGQQPKNSDESALKSLSIDPMSMLDWGLYRADRDLNELMKKLNDALEKYRLFRRHYDSEIAEMKKSNPTWTEEETSKWQETYRESGNSYRLSDLSNASYQIDWVHVVYDLKNTLIDINFRAILDIELTDNDWKYVRTHPTEGFGATFAEKITPEMCSKILNNDIRNMFYHTILNPGDWGYAANVADTWFGHNGFFRSGTRDKNQRNFFEDIAKRIHISVYLGADPYRFSDSWKIKCTTDLTSWSSPVGGSFRYEVRPAAKSK